MALAAPLVSRKRRRYPIVAPKRMLTGLQRGTGRPASPCSGGNRRDLGNAAAMAAFGESCRDSGHGFSSVFAE
jgi:hypothetical protein